MLFGVSGLLLLYIIIVHTNKNKMTLYSSSPLRTRPNPPNSSHTVSGQQLYIPPTLNPIYPKPRLPQNPPTLKPIYPKTHLPQNPPTQTYPKTHLSYKAIPHLPQNPPEPAYSKAHLT